MDKKNKIELKHIIHNFKQSHQQLINMLDNEELKLENLSCYFVDTQQMQDIETNISYLENAISDIGDIIDNLSELI